MIKQMRLQGVYIVDIAEQIGCSERTVRRYLKYPEPPVRKTRFKMAKLRPFMDYIDMRLAENVWNAEVILHEIKAMGYTGGRSMLRYYIQPKRKMRPGKKTVRFETQPGYRSPRARKGEASIVSPNRLQRQFNPDAPDERWVTDITYIRTHEGWLYLAVVVDL